MSISPPIRLNPPAAINCDMQLIDIMCAKGTAMNSTRWESQNNHGKYEMVGSLVYVLGSGSAAPPSPDSFVADCVNVLEDLFVDPVAVM